ncbi:MAG TPA: DUF2156 domain-containing protein [Kofleriaceae bacterium]|nr:DUF2156 domain-containing protein [Kofleriaceae bacterium]
MRHAPRESVPGVAAWVRAHGCAVSTALLDPACRHFFVPGVPGVIGYREGWGCAVGLGDPVCPPEQTGALVDAFGDFCHARDAGAVFAVASPALTALCVARGWAAIEFGVELILDPRRDPQSGARGRELRKKVNRAKKAGVTVHEHHLGDPLVERAMEQCALSWLGARRGPQIYLARVRLFADPLGKRWFYALFGERIVGVLSMMRLDARDGWLLDHLIATPDAPGGTTERLAAHALGVLGAEGCRFATFGPAPSAELGRVVGLGPVAEALARGIYETVGRVFHLDARVRYRKKFQVERTEASSLVFSRGLGLRELTGVLRAFNVSLG